MVAIDFKAHLAKQIGFLERSCASFDAGFHDEAIRIATIIRVLIHQTKSSTSLLKHLNATNIKLLSTCKEAGPRTLILMGMGIVGISSNGTTTYKPNLGDIPFTTSMPVNQWWDAVVFVSGPTRLSRRKIALAAANQDGGAHVDHALDTTYEKLTTPGFAGTVFHGSRDALKVDALEGSHLVSLRQMGYELLNSPELLRIVSG